MEADMPSAGRVYLQCKLWLKGILSQGDPTSKLFGSSSNRTVVLLLMTLCVGLGGLLHISGVLQGPAAWVLRMGAAGEGPALSTPTAGPSAAEELAAANDVLLAAKDVVLEYGSMPPPASQKAQKACLQHKAEPKYRLTIPPRTCKCGRNNPCQAYDRPPVSVVVPMGGSNGMPGLTKALSAAAPAFAQHPTAEAIVVVPGTPGESAMNSKAVKKALQPYIGKVYRSNPLERGLVVHVLGALRNKARAVEAALVRGANGEDVLVSKPGRTTTPDLLNRRRLAAAGADCAGDPQRVSFLLEYFRRPRSVGAIGKALAKSFKVPTEVLVHDDSASEVEQWLKALRAGEGYLLEAGNVHEIRAYNRLVKMARGETIVLLQDDDLPPSSGSWLSRAQSLFAKFPKLALLGGYSGTIQGGPYSGKYSTAVGRSSGGRNPRNRIPVASISGGIGRFMFVTFTNLAPFVMRRQVLMKMGLFNQNFSCRGEAGIGFDYEIGLRMWKDGYQVGVYDHGFTFNYGDSGSTGTRASSRIYSKRLKIETRNAAWYTKMYTPFYKNHAPTGGQKDEAKEEVAGGNAGAGVRVAYGQKRFLDARLVPASRLSKVHRLVTDANARLGVPTPP